MSINVNDKSIINRLKLGYGLHSRLCRGGVAGQARNDGHGVGIAGQARNDGLCYTPTFVLLRKMLCDKGCLFSLFCIWMKLQERPARLQNHTFEAGVRIGIIKKHVSYVKVV